MTDDQAPHVTFDTSEPAWWIDGLPLPEGWTVTGQLHLAGPDGWVSIQFRDGAPATELIAMVTGATTHGQAT
jgi:hypothetical protein